MATPAKPRRHELSAKPLLKALPGLCRRERGTAPETKTATKDYCVCLPASGTCTFYIGVTSDLTRRLSQHQRDLLPGFTRKRGVHRLVYSDRFGEVTAATASEKKLKGYSRAQKVAPIESANPKWKDLSGG